MDDIFLEDIIGDAEQVEKIEVTTHNYYKKITELINLINLNEIELKDFELVQELGLDEAVGSVDVNAIRSDIKELKDEINSIFEGVMEFSIKNNFYWCYSGLETYQYYFDAFFSNFRRITKDDGKINFLKNELNYFNQYQLNNYISSNPDKTNFIHRTGIIDPFCYVEFYEYLYDSNRLKIQVENEKRIEFIVTEIERLGYKVKLKENQYIFKKKPNEVVSTESDDDIEVILSRKSLPELSLLERYELIKELQIDKLISRVDTSEQSKNKLLALVMGIHPDNARKLMNNKYPKLKTKEEIKRLTKEANQKVKAFFNKPVNDIKIT